MAGDADRSDDRIANTIADGIEACRRAVSIKPCGRCYYCDEPIPPHHLFCSGDCSVDWRHEQERKKAIGL